MTIQIKRALVSVSDKTDIVEFCQGLNKLGIEILSTGGTANLLSANNLPVIEVSDYTGFPEMMEGRLKTLHPKIHGGILGRRGIDDESMATQGINPIDLVIVNLYPFAQTIAKPGCDLATAIENIDIGGPTMVRAAAKNHAAVGIVVESDDYKNILDELRENGTSLSPETRFQLAAKAFAHTARYDSTIAAYLGEAPDNTLPESLTLSFRQQQPMRYGENPHQQAAFYVESAVPQGSISSAQQLQGKALSYNNIADTDAALECVKSFPEGPACVIVKHANPCGVARANSLLEAYDRAYATDPTSAFGGIIAFNQPLDNETAQAIIERQFVEVIIAPGIAPEAQQIIASKKNLRLLDSGPWTHSTTQQMDFKRVAGGLLAQESDIGVIARDDIQMVSKRQPTEAELSDLLFSWKIVKFVKSNAIVYCKQLQTIGIGAGQMSRVYSARIAAIKAADEGLEVKGSVMASDAFFPFRDGIDSAAEAGIIAVIQPGGSIRDNEIIEAADENDMAMVFTGMRHFRH